MSIKKLISTITGLSVISLGSIHAINGLITSSAESHKDLLKTKSGHFYHWTYGQVFYSVSGSGSSPLLLIHDTAVESSGMEWEKLISYLGQDYKVYTLDLPGCGRSEKPAITYTSYLFVLLIQSFIRDVIKEETTVAASSLSGSFVFLAAAFDDHMIKQIYAINPLPLSKLASSVTPTGKMLRTMMTLPVIGTCIYHIATNRRNIEFLFAEKLYNNPFRIDKVGMEKAYVASHLRGSDGKYLLASIKGGYVYCDIRHVLKKIDVPVTLIVGDNQRYAKQAALSYRKLNPSFVMKTVMYSKSLPHKENPAATASFMKIG